MENGEKNNFAIKKNEYLRTLRSGSVILRNKALG